MKSIAWKRIYLFRTLLRARLVLTKVASRVAQTEPRGHVVRMGPLLTTITCAV